MDSQLHHGFILVLVTRGSVGYLWWYTVYSISLLYSLSASGKSGQIICTARLMKGTAYNVFNHSRVKSGKLRPSPGTNLILPWASVSLHLKQVCWPHLSLRYCWAVCSVAECFLIFLFLGELKLEPGGGCSLSQETEECWSALGLQNKFNIFVVLYFFSCFLSPTSNIQSQTVSPSFLCVEIWTGQQEWLLLYKLAMLYQNVTVFAHIGGCLIRGSAL